jgi:hypothetical protein
MERFRSSISLNRGNGDNEEIVHADALKFLKRMQFCIRIRSSFADFSGCCALTCGGVARLCYLRLLSAMIVLKLP